MKFGQGKLRSMAFWLLLIVGALAVTVPAQSLGQGNFTSLVDAFPQLANLTLKPNQNSNRKPTEGGQNFTHCCLLAVNQSLEIVDGYVVEKSLSFINATVDVLLAATAGDQFPCGAVWNGNSAGAPIVEVPDSWLEKTCPGWQLSDTKKGDDSEFISPFVGFLLPAVVFCLTIPRRRKLAVWQKLFMPDLSQLISWILAPFAMIVAGIFVVCDTIVWLSMCFAFASPMLLSGFYEAFLDNRIIGFLIEKQRNFRLTLDMRARLLFLILVGNLDLEPELRETDAELIVLSNHHRDDSHKWPNETGNSFRNPSSPWTHIENLVYPLRSYRDQSVGTPRQYPIHDVRCELPGCTNLAHKEVPIQRNLHVQREIGRTKTRLRTMLACQYSFGSTVGAPVVFFLGAFVFNIVTALEALGDESTSLALAFGMWYMIIPHIAIVSGLLLAGNNPNTLEGVVALEVGDIEVEAEDDFERKHFGTKLFELAYDSRYRPSWIWMRGRSKKKWIEKLLKTYQFRPAPGSSTRDPVPDEDMEGLKDATTLSLRNWTTILSLTMLLMGVPFVLAFLTGYYTPQVGLSCRSLTFSIYAICQVSQLCLWLWAWADVPEQAPYCAFIRRGGWLDKHGFYTPTRVSTLWSRKTFFTLPSLWAIIWYNLATVFGLGGVITSIGGTTMQLMGVYSSDKCDINAIYWTRPHANIKLIISTNYAEEIKDASTYWKACAVTATVFLGAVSFCGWWYQRRLRGLFRELVSNIGNPKYDREDIQSRRVVPGTLNGQTRQ
ncbi:hypothetical protein D0Z07_2684 [Hyphodiscus hymeniophilus]|uniref:Uncharacterized protein n=1 Tax=Hyphodiscus hymeniophilus TaxID=353542 RepID=A0A9P6VN56_9HELO|nr:hypothetical protein D0Z07_2684 [Hyphodiscus hymeniophilus]